MDGENWNFNGYIAYPLEMIAREILGLDEREVKETIFSATRICNGTFAEAMYELLHYSENYIDPNDMRTFEKQIDDYWGKGYMEIPQNKSMELFDEFKSILKQKKA